MDFGLKGNLCFALPSQLVICSGKCRRWQKKKEERDAKNKNKKEGKEAKKRNKNEYQGFLNKNNPFQNLLNKLLPVD